MAVHGTHGGHHPVEGPITILVIDHSRARAILDRLRRAGHRVIDADEDADELDRLLAASSGRELAEHQRSHAGIHLDLHERVVRVHDRIVELSRLEFDLLAVLLESPRRVLSHGEIAERVWENCDVDTKSISVLVSRLRRRIIDAGGPRVAHAVHGVGYRLACGT